MRSQAKKSNIASRAGRVAAALLMVPLMGCASSQAAPVASPSATVANPAETSASPSATASVPTERWDAILADLAKRGVDTTSVQVVSAAEISWPDSSLGCPEEGRAYPQSIVPGFQVVVEVDGTEYDYHFDDASGMLLCEK